MMFLIWMTRLKRVAGMLASFWSARSGGGGMMAAFHGFLLKQFDGTSLKSTRQQWEHQATKHGLLVTDYRSRLEWVENHMDYKDGGDEGLAYGIFHNDHKHAVATV